MSRTPYQINTTKEQRERIKELLHSCKMYNETNAEVMIKALETKLRGLNCECDDKED